MDGGYIKNGRSRLLPADGRSYDVHGDPRTISAFFIRKAAKSLLHVAQLSSSNRTSRVRLRRLTASVLMILMMIQIRAARYLDTGKYLVNAARAYGKRTRGSAVTGRHSVSRPTCCKRRCWLIAGCWLNNVVGWYTDCRYRSVRRPPVKKRRTCDFEVVFDWCVITVHE